jgi:uncharacterized protein
VSSEPIKLSLPQARRIAVRTQLLDGSAKSVLETVRRIGFLQLDPIARVAPSHRIVLWSRLGPWNRDELDRLLWRDRKLFEWNAFVYPIEDLPIIRARIRRWRRSTHYDRERWVRQFLTDNRAFRRYVLRRLEQEGPLLSRQLEDRAAGERRDHRWWGPRRVGLMLMSLHLYGEVAVVGRNNGQRLWDLAERWYPPSDTVPLSELDARMEEKRLRTLGIARRGPGLRAVVEGISGEWRVHEKALALAEKPAPRRTTLLSPFDRLIHDRDRTESLFDFFYRIEIYVPAAKREYGYYVLPVLHGDRLVGRIDPEHDRKAGVLRVHKVFWEDGAPKNVPLERPLKSLARFLGAREVSGP